MKRWIGPLATYGRCSTSGHRLPRDVGKKIDVVRARNDRIVGSRGARYRYVVWTKQAFLD
jgi:hypothetical protein